MALFVDIQKNGAFSIETGCLSIRDCFPGLDERPVRPVSVDVDNKGAVTEISYHLVEGSIVLKIFEQNEKILIESTLYGFSAAPHWFYPIFQAAIKGITGVYRQGFGILGPSGYLECDELEKKGKKAESYGMIALKRKEGYLYILADSHDRFINRYDVEPISRDDTQKCLCAGFSTENIPHSTLSLPCLFLFEDEELDHGLESCANMIASAMNARKVHPPAYHWCSWYYLFSNTSHFILKNYLEGFLRLNPPIYLKYIQIDAGYYTSAGDWLSFKHLWPNGIKAAFDDIHKYGYKPGIWIAPFMVGNNSELYRNHPDWILLWNDGQPVTPWKIYDLPQINGDIDQEYYVLDTSNPLAMDYIRKVFRTLKDWGAGLFKTDFMLWGIQDSTKVKRFSPGKTSVEYFRDFLKVIREEIGDECYWLACISPFMPFVGYADAMRISGDVGAKWSDPDDIEHGTPNMINEVVADNYFNHILWQNDPDAIMLRDFHIYLSDVEVESLALFQAMSGGAIYTSDPLHEIAEKRVRLFRFIEPKGETRPYIPFLDQMKKEIVLCNRISEDMFAVLFFNPTFETITDNYDIKVLTKVDDGFVRLWNTGDFSERKKDSILVKIPPHGSKLYFISTSKVLSEEIKNLWRP